VLNEKQLHQFAPMLGPPDRYPSGSLEWAERMSNRLQLETQSVSTHTVQHLKQHIVQMWTSPIRPWDIYPVPPYNTPDDYCRKMTGHSWKGLLAVISELTGDKDFERTMLADNARAQAEHRTQGARTDRHVYKINKLKRGGTGAAYLLRRLARDHPEILAQYERGEFKSVREAAKKAEIIKAKSTPTPFQTCERLIPKLTADERAILKEIINRQDATSSAPPAVPNQSSTETSNGKEAWKDNERRGEQERQVPATPHSEDPALG
jgi:hypothetical protein